MTRQEAIARLTTADYWNNPAETHQLLRAIYYEYGLLLELEWDERIGDEARAYCIKDDCGRKVYISKHSYMNAISAMTQGMYRLAKLLQQQEETEKN